MAANVITFLERFAIASQAGAAKGPWYSPWVPLPPGCTEADFLMRCLAQATGTVTIALETSMDGTTLREVTASNFGTEEDLVTAVSGLGLLVRAKFDIKTGPIELVVSAYLIPKLV